MVETRHVKIEFEEALSGKKELLSSEIDILKIGKKIKNYKVLRKKELAVKRKLKSEFGKLKGSLGLVLAGFPSEGGEKVKVGKKVKKVEEEEGKDFYGELDEIKEKLERLGG